jgi:hypothetical protein
MCVPYYSWRVPELAVRILETGECERVSGVGEKRLERLRDVD